MSRVIEFIILILCIALSTSIIVWTVRCENKTHQPPTKKKK